jgi:enoyl-[acyl-carrier-protein] reductase (NADH)
MLGLLLATQGAAKLFGDDGGSVINIGTAPSLGGDIEKQLLALTPLGRSGRPDDIAPVAVFLASDESRWVTGDTLVVSGGLR